MILMAEADIPLHFSGHTRCLGALESGGSAGDPGTAFRNLGSRVIS